VPRLRIGSREWIEDARQYLAVPGLDEGIASNGPGALAEAVRNGLRAWRVSMYEGELAGRSGDEQDTLVLFWLGWQAAGRTALRGIRGHMPDCDTIVSRVNEVEARQVGAGRCSRAVIALNLGFRFGSYYSGCAWLARVRVERFRELTTVAEAIGFSCTPNMRVLGPEFGRGIWNLCDVLRLTLRAGVGGPRLAARELPSRMSGVASRLHTLPLHVNRFSEFQRWARSVRHPASVGLRRAVPERWRGVPSWWPWSRDGLSRAGFDALGVVNYRAGHDAEPASVSRESYRHDSREVSSRVGIEIEGYPRHGLGTWVAGHSCVLKHDGSLGAEGVELASEPMAWAQVLAWCESFPADNAVMYCGGRECGLHIHYSRDGFIGGRSHLERLLSVQGFASWSAALAVVGGRLSNTYCYAADKLLGRYRDWLPSRPYAICNRDYTVEFRLFRPIAHPVWLRRCVEFGRALIDWTRPGTTALGELAEPVAFADFVLGSAKDYPVAAAYVAAQWDGWSRNWSLEGINEGPAEVAVAS